MKLKEHNDFRGISWQIEMLIAGGIFYTLYTSTDFFRDFYLQKEAITNYGHYQIILLFGLYILTRALLIGFGGNLLLRTVWIAYMAIEYWYPKGIDFNALKLPSHVEQRLKSGNTTGRRLENLEKWASLSFSFAILFALILLSTLLVCLLVCVILLELFGLRDLVYSPVFNYILALMVLLAQLGILQRFSVKSNQTFLDQVLRILGKAYYYISGSFLYHKELLVLRSNSRGWVLASFAIFYVLMASLISINQLGAFFSGGTFKVNIWDDRTTYEQRTVYRMRNQYYEDNLSAGELFKWGGIPSELIKGRQLKLFIVHWYWMDYYAEDVLDSIGFSRTFPRFQNDSLRTEFLKNQFEKYQNTLNEILTVELNGQKIDSIRWDRYKHPKTGEEGYLTYLGVDSLKMGRHTLEVYRRYGRKPEQQNTWMSLPFWKE